MKYKVIVLDLDGTLTNSKKEISPRTYSALIEAQEKGVVLVLASGRPTYGITPLAEQLQMDKFGGYILSFNGGKIINYKTKETIMEQTLEQELLPWLYNISKKSETTIVSYSPNGKEIFTENPNDSYAMHEAKLNKMDIKGVDNFIEAISHAPNKCLIVGEPEKLIPIESHINEKEGHRMNAFRSEPFFLELVPKGIDKALSLERLLSVIGHKREEMVAIGDGYNDLTMIRYAGLGVAMENAQQEVKEVADHITLSNDNDGVAHLLDKIM